MKKIILQVNKILIIAILIVAGIAIYFTNGALAAFNKQLNYQGKLANTAGTAVADGSYNVRYKLYTTATGGSPIWSETWCYSADSGATCTGSGTDNRAPLVSGLFSSLLGSISSMDAVDFDQTLYLGVEVGGSAATPVWDGEMTPRKKLGAVPAAFVAETARTLQGFTPSQFLRSDTQNATSSSTTFLNVIQTGAGKIAEFFGASSQSVLSILSNGNVGIGTTTPTANLAVEGNSTLGNNATAGYFTATTSTASVLPSASTTNLTISKLYDSAGSAGTNGMILQTSGSTASWVATSSLGLAQTSDLNSYLALSSWYSTTTDQLTQGINNKYYSTQLFSTDLAGTTTDALAQGLLNKYYSTLLFSTDLAGTTTDALDEGLNNKYWTNDRFDARLSATTTLPNLTTLLGLTNLIVVNSTTTNATTTSLNISGPITGGGLTSCSGAGDKLIWNATTRQFACGADAGAGGGITALAAEYSSFQTGSSQRFATSSDTNILLTITSAGDTHTFTPSWTGTLAAARGGTGIGSVTANQILIGNSTGTGWTQVSTSSLGLVQTSDLNNYFSLSSWYSTTTDQLAEGVLHKYYSDALVNTFIHASSTIAKTYTANTFTGGQTFNGSNIFGGSAVFNSTVTVGSLNGPLQANNGVVSATTSVGVLYGGTGLTSIASSSVLVGGPNNTMIGMATSSLGVNLSDTTGTLTSARGGTGISSVTAAGILLGNYSGTGWMQLSTSSLGLAQTSDLNSYLTLVNWYSTTTDQLAEGINNKYWTDDRFDARLSATTTLPNLTTLLGLSDIISTRATTTSLHISGPISGAGLSSCSGSADKLIWNAATRQFACGADAGAGGGLTALGAQYSAFQSGSSQTFATSSDTNILLTITSAGDTHTFTPSWTGTLAATRGGTGISSVTAAGILLGDYSGTGWMQLATSTLAINTDNLVQGITNLFYSDALVNTYIHSSSTIAKTYTANTFTGGQTFNGSNIFGGSAVFNSTVTVGSLNGPLQANNGVVSATTSVGVLYGGTGLTSIASSSVLVGGPNNTMIGMSTSSLGLGFSSIIGTLPVSQGGTGQTSFGQGWLNSDGTTITSSTSPTVAWITATSTTATSTFAGGLQAGGSTGLYVLQNGNVGIGTTNPSNKFTVNGQSLFHKNSFGDTLIDGDTLYVGYENLPSGNYTQIYEGTINANQHVYSPVFGRNGAGGISGLTIDTTEDAEVLNFQINDITKMVLNYAGNVGIGTTTPGSILSVAGVGNFASVMSTMYSALTAPYFTATSTSVASAFPYASTTALTVSGTNGLQLSTGLNGPLQANNGVVSATTSIGVLYGGTGLTTAPTYGKVLLGNSSGGYDIVATSSLGFGTGFGSVTSVDASGGTTGFSFTGGPITGAGTLTLSGILNVANGGTGWANISSGYIPFGNGASALATSSSFFWDNTNARLGIGTSSPYAKLSVAGEVVASHFTATSTTATSVFAGSLNVGNGAIVYDNTTGTTTINYLEAGNMTFAADSGVISWIDMPVTSASVNGVVNSYSANLNGNSLLTIYGISNGNGAVTNTAVGIGTTSPNWKLSVAGDGSFDSFVRASYFTATSSTASTFPYASTTALTVSGTNGLQLATGLNGPLQANNGLVSATSSIGVLYGGTGLTTAPAYGQILLGNASSGYTLTSTSSLGISFANIVGNFGKSWEITNNIFSQSSLAPTTTQNIAVSGTGTSTFVGGLEAWRQVAAPYFHATSTTATSTFAGGVSVDNGLTLVGSASNIRLNTNWLSYDGADKGLSIDSSNNMWLSSESDKTIKVVAISSGANIGKNLTISSGVGKGGKSGDLYLLGADGSSQYYDNVAGGNIYMFPGAASGPSGSSGNVIIGGDFDMTDVGRIFIEGNVSGEMNTAGDVYIYGGIPDTIEPGVPTTGGNVILANSTTTAIGNVGISTTSPNWKLSVAGDGSFDSFVRASYFTSTSTTASTFPYASTTQISIANQLYDKNNSSGTSGYVLMSTNSGTQWVATSSIQNGVSSISQTYGTAQTGAITFATSSQTTNGQTIGLNITNSSGAFTFAPTISGTLAVAGGGTGNTSFASSTLAISNGTNLYGFATSSLGIALSDTTGTLAIARGGTNATTIGASSTLAFSNGSAYTFMATSSLGLRSSDVGLGNVSNTAQVTAVTATYPIISSGGLTPVISTAFGTSTTIGVGTDKLLSVNGSGVIVASSTIGNGQLQYSTISGVALGGTLANLTATDGTLTFSGTYTGATARTIGLNLGQANTWTALQQFANASSSVLSAYSAYFGGTATSSFSNAGVLTLAGNLNGPLDVRNGVVGATTTIGALYGGTGQTSYTTGDILYSNATNALTKLGIGTGGYVLGVSNGVPAWVATTTLANISGTLAVSSGGTGQTSFTSGNLLYGSGTGAIQNVATTSATLGLGLSYSGTLGALVGGASGSLTVATSSLYTGTTGQLPYFSGTNTLTATSSIFLASSGNVGIGTIIPSYKLDVRGDIGIEVGKKLYFDGTGDGFAYIFDDLNNVTGHGANTFIVGSVNGNFAFTNGEQPALASMVIKNENIGIGSTTPGALFSVGSTGQGLQVNSAGTITSGTWNGSTIGLLYGGTGNTSFASSTLAISNGTLLYGFATSSLGIALSDTTGTLAIARGGTNATTIGASSTLAFSNGTAYTFMATSSLGISIANIVGNFGKSWELTNNIFSQSSLAPTTTQNIAVSGTGTSTFAGGLEAWRQIAAPYFHATSTTATSTFAGGLQAGGATGLTVLQNGNVGIGTAVPGYKLDVNTNNASFSPISWIKQATRGYLYADSSGIGIADASESTINDLIYLNPGLHTIDFYSNGSNRMTIGSTGNVGIGSTTPYAKLSITNTGTGPSFIVEDSTSPDTTPFIVDADGNVGIGTVSPAQKLSVSGSIQWGNIIYPGFSGHLTQGGTDAFLNPSITRNLLGNTGATYTIANAEQTGYAGIEFGKNQDNDIYFYANEGTFTTGESVTPTTRMFIDAGTGNVGIGTTSPETKLHILTTSTNLPATSGTTQSSGQAMRIRAPSSSAILDIGTAGGTGAWLQSTLQSDLSTNYPLLINPNGGNVGIGTTSPYARLSLTDGGTGSDTTLALNNRFRFTGDGVLRWGSTANAGLLSWDTGAIIGSQSGYPVQIVTNGSEKIRIDTTGNVGIGTTTPDQKLNVFGNAVVGGSLAGQQVRLTSAGVPNYGTAIYLNNDKGATQGAIRLLSTQNISGAAGIGTVARSNFALQYSTDANTYGADTSTLTYATALTVEGNSGKIGIGTTSPYAKLSVEHLSTTGTVIGTDALTGFTGNLLDLKVASTSKFTVDYLGDITTGGTFTLSNIGKNMLITSDASGNLVSSSTPTAAAYSATSTTATSTFAGGMNVAGTSGLTVLQNSKVGIGTVSPIQKLHVSGGDIFLENSGGNPAILLGDSSSSGNYGYMQWNSANDRLDFFGTTGVTAMSILESGNVGIGTTSPLGKLHIRGNTTATQIWSNSSAGTNMKDWRLGFTSTALFLGTLDEGSASTGDAAITIGRESNSNDVDYIDFAVNNEANRIRYTNAGLLGIGTTSPTAQLSIYPYSAGDKRAIDFQAIAGATGGGSAISTIGSWSQQMIMDIDYSAKSSNEFFAVRANGTDYRMLVDSSGNVGIGTTTPNNKLSVYTSSTAAPSTGARGVFEFGGSAVSLIGGVDSNSPYAFWMQAQNNVNGVTTYPISLNPLGGNVGIGTTSPSDLLHIYGATGKGVTLDNTGVVAGNGAALTFNQTYLSSNAVGRIQSTLVSASDSTARRAGMSFSIKKNGDALGTLTEAMRIDESGNVGIGTTTPGVVNGASPTAKLHVANSSGGAGAIIDGTSFAQLLFNESENAANSRLWRQIVNGENMQFSSMNDALTEKNNVLTLTNAGNVGIGTTSPLARLSIKGTNTSATKSFILTDSSDLERFSIDNAGTTLVTGNLMVKTSNLFGFTFTPSNVAPYTNTITVGGGEQIGFKEGNDIWMLINADGNVGIGTTSPGYKLDVYGDIRIKNNSGIYFDNPSGTASKILTYDSTGHLILNAPSTGDDIYFQTGSDINARISANGDIYMGGTSAATAPKLFVNGSSGNVGIGTTSPAAKLDIYSDSSNTTQFGVVNGLQLTNPNSTANTYSNLIFSGLDTGGVNTGFAGIQGTQSDKTFGSVSGFLTFATRNSGTLSEKMRITADGNVGIGTTSPYAKLAVVGEIVGANFTATTTATSTMPRLTSTGIETNWLCLSTDCRTSWPTGGAGGGGVGWATTTGSNEAIYFYGTGNVGIGTSSPYAKLSVVGETVSTYFTATSTTATSTFAGGLNVGSGNLVYDFSTGITSASAFQTGNLNFETDAGAVTWVDLPLSSATAGTVESFTASIAGNPGITVYGTTTGSGVLTANHPFVGIGTTTPSKKLSVAGDIYVGGSGTSTIEKNLHVMGTLRSSLSYVGDLIFANDWSFTEAPLGTTSQGIILRNQDAKDLMTIDEKGNLSLVGDICSQGKQCFGKTVDDLADYVSVLASSTNNSLFSVQASTTLSLSEMTAALSGLTTSVRNSSQGLFDLNAKVDLLSSTIASTTDLSILSTSVGGLVSAELTASTTFLQSIASSTASLLLADLQATSTTATSSPDSFIGRVARAVADYISNTSSLIFSKISSTLATFNRVETETAAVSHGLEMTDQATGQKYCVSIKNGDWDKQIGACGTLAAAVPPTPPVPPAPIMDPAVTIISTSTTIIVQDPPVIVPGTATSTGPVTPNATTTDTTSGNSTGGTGSATTTDTSNIVPPTDPNANAGAGAGAETGANAGDNTGAGAQGGADQTPNPANTTTPTPNPTPAPAPASEPAPAPVVTQGDTAPVGP